MSKRPPRRRNSGEVFGETGGPDVCKVTIGDGDGERKAAPSHFCTQLRQMSLALVSTFTSYACAPADEAATQSNEVKEDVGAAPLPFCRINLLTVGESGVGKTSLVVRFTQNRFFPGHAPTIGVEFASRVVQTTAENGSKKLKFHIWDTSGHESFRSLTRSYYSNALMVLLVFDVQRRDSFESLRTWVTKCRELAPPGAMIMLVGNKIDVDERHVREVSQKEASDFAVSHRLNYFETSAKTGEGVQRLFGAAADAVWSGIGTGELDPLTTKGITVLSPPSSSSSSRGPS